MKEQLKVNEEVNENLDVLFEELEEKKEFRFYTYNSTTGERKEVHPYQGDIC